MRVPPHDSFMHINQGCCNLIGSRNGKDVRFDQRVSVAEQSNDGRIEVAQAHSSTPVDSPGNAKESHSSRNSSTCRHHFCASGTFMSRVPINDVAAFGGPTSTNTTGPSAIKLFTARVGSFFTRGAHS